MFTDFYRFFGLSWETTAIKNYHSEDSEHSGSRRIEFSSKSTTFCSPEAARQKAGSGSPERRRKALQVCSWMLLPWARPNPSTNWLQMMSIRHHDSNSSKTVVAQNSRQTTWTTKLGLNWSRKTGAAGASTKKECFAPLGNARYYPNIPKVVIINGCHSNAFVAASPRVWCCNSFGWMLHNFEKNMAIRKTWTSENEKNNVLRILLTKINDTLTTSSHLYMLVTKWVMTMVNE